MMTSRTVQSESQTFLTEYFLLFLTTQFDTNDRLIWLKAADLIGPCTFIREGHYGLLLLVRFWRMWTVRTTNYRPGSPGWSKIEFSSFELKKSKFLIDQIVCHILVPALNHHFPALKWILKMDSNDFRARWFCVWPAWWTTGP